MQCGPAINGMGYILQLPSNNLTGQLPSSWFHFCSLQDLELTGNFLSGSLPLFSNISLISWLALGNNYFNGELPASWCTSCLVLICVINGLSQFPAAGDLPNLAGISLFDNDITGTIPECLTSRPYLWTLDLSYNHLEGTMPNVKSDQLMLLVRFSHYPDRLLLVILSPFTIRILLAIGSLALCHIGK